MRISKQQILTLVLLVILIPIGFYTKLYSGLGAEWVHNKLGGVFYEIFWCLVFFFLLPRSKAISISIWVFIITCILEFVQLLNNEILELIRSNPIGQTIIGNSFSWSDFPYYVAGSFLGFLIIVALKKVK